MAQRIVPMIAYEDAAAAIDWLSEAFGFAERAEHRYTDENGVVGHAELELGGEIVMLATPSRDYQGPRRHRRDCEAGTAGSTIRGSSTASSSRSTISTSTMPVLSPRERQ